MMASSCQDYHLILDSAAYLPNTTIEMLLHQQYFGEIMINDSSYLDCYYSFEANLEISAIDARAYGNSNSLDNGCSPVQGEPYIDKIPKLQQGSVETKRKNNDETSFITGQPKDTIVESKSKKSRKRHSGGLKEKEERKPEVDGMKASKTCGEPPAKFVHGRARRGQATDSHSLAERARREKISERMKTLQSLVPGCDTITGKAHILDEIINYVQCLQNQVEFLSMKLASVSPMLYDSGMDFDDSMSQPEFNLQEGMRSMAQPMPSIGETSPFQPTASNNETNNYQMMDPSVGHTSLTQDGAVL